MKKIFCTMVFATMIFWVGTASALPFYDLATPASNHVAGTNWTFSFNLAKDTLSDSWNGPGTDPDFSPITINSNDTITDAWIGFNFAGSPSGINAIIKAGKALIFNNLPMTEPYGDGTNYFGELSVFSYLKGEKLTVTVNLGNNDLELYSALLGGSYDQPATAPVPEPATMLLFGAGIAGLAVVGRKKFGN